MQETGIFVVPWAGKKERPARHPVLLRPDELLPVEDEHALLALVHHEEIRHGAGLADLLHVELAGRDRVRDEPIGKLDRFEREKREHGGPEAPIGSAGGDFQSWHMGHAGLRASGRFTTVDKSPHEACGGV